jgi:hypothetical protein
LARSHADLLLGSQLRTDKDGAMNRLWGTWFLAIVFFIVLGLALQAHAKPTHIAQEGGVTITLHDDKCALSAVSTLPLRVTWKENGKSFEGCIGQHPAGVLILYFTDGSIVLMSPQMFSRVTGT